MIIPIAGKDYELKLPKDHLSPSQIDTYLNCPQQYYRKYVCGEKEPYQAPLAEGQAWHSLMQITNLAKLKTGEHIARSEAFTVHKRACKAEAKKVQKGPADWEEWFDRGEGFIRSIWKGKKPPVFEPIVMPDGKPGVEWKWSIELAGVKVDGISDLVEKGCVSDFKVASTAQFYCPISSTQANLNRIACDRKRFMFEVFEKRSGKKRDLSHKVDDLEKVRRWCTFQVANVAQAISLGAFPPTSPEKNKLCDERWCGFWDTCVGACR